MPRARSSLLLVGVPNVNDARHMDVFGQIKGLRHPIGQFSTLTPLQ